MPRRRRSTVDVPAVGKIKKSTLRALGGSLLLIAVGVALGGLGTMVYRHYHPTPVSIKTIDEPPITTPKGETSLGTPTVVVDNVRMEPNYVQTQPRKICAWGEPGSMPWRGDNYSAALAMNVPKASARKLVDKYEHHEGGIRAYVSNSRIWADNGMQFSPWMIMTFANTVCYGTRANFKDDTHVEAGWLYEHDGNWLFDPDVCHNITRLTPEGEAEDNRYLDVPFAPEYPGAVPYPNAYGVPDSAIIIPDLPRRAQPYAAPYPYVNGQVVVRKHRHRQEEEGRPSGPGQVPEPETLSLIFLGIGVMLLAARRRRKLPADEA